jgi:hypothetical protein
VREGSRHAVRALGGARLAVGAEEVLAGQHGGHRAEPVEHPRQDVAEDQPEEDGDAAEETAQADGHHDHRDRGEQRDPWAWTAAAPPTNDALVPR